MSEEADRVIRRHGQLKENRINWDSHWDEIAKYYLPRKDDVYVRHKTPGEKKNTQLFDSTGVHVNELLASALHSGLTNPAVEFFQLTTGDPELDAQDDVRKFLQSTVREMHRLLNDSNFHNEIHEVYLDLGSFGTGFLIMEEDDKFGIRFKSRPIYEAYVSENNKGMIDTVSREFKWSLRQIVQEFGEEALDARSMEKYVKQPDCMEEIIHQVGPMEGSKKGFQYFSKYVLKAREHILRDSGFKEFPFLVPRWTKISGEVYGRSPGMKALPDMKMLNSMMQVTIRSAQKVVDPPLLLPDDGIFLPLKTAPNSLNYRRAGVQDPIEPLATGARVDFGIQMIQEIRSSVERAFFIDQLQLREGPQKTATETVQLIEEQNRLLSPALSRQNFEALRPLVDRLFGIMFRKEMLPPIPEILSEKNITPVYSSSIAKAQRTADAASLLRAVENVGFLIEADPTILDNIDGDEALRHMTRVYNVPQELILDKDVVAEMRDERRKALERQRQLDEEQQQAETANKAVPALAALNQGE